MNIVQSMLNGGIMYALGLRSNAGTRVELRQIFAKNLRLLTARVGWDTFQTSHRQLLYLGLLSVPLTAVPLLLWTWVLSQVAGLAAAPWNL